MIIQFQRSHKLQGQFFFFFFALQKLEPFWKQVGHCKKIYVVRRVNQLEILLQEEKQGWKEAQSFF